MLTKLKTIAIGLCEVVAIAVIALTLNALYQHASKVYLEFVASGSSNHSLPAVRLGTALSLNGIDLSQKAVGVILFLSPSCTYCLQSHDFYRIVGAAARARDVPIVVAVPNRETAYVQSTGLRDAYVMTWNEIAVRVPGTPTLMLVDSQATIRRIWTGKLSKEREADVLEFIENPGRLDQEPKLMGSGEAVLSTDDVSNLRASGRSVTVIDVRERESVGSHPTSESVNIPVEELHIRSHFELRREDLQVVDCSTINEPICQYAVNVLVDAAFDVVVLNGPGVYVNSCQATL